MLFLRVNSAMTRRVRLASTSPSPRAARRTPSTRSVMELSLRRMPHAPASNAPNTYSSMSNVVMTMTAGAESSCWMRRVASRPSPPGMRMSMHTTSGWRCCATVRASSPVLASPITSMSPEAWRIVASPARMSASSSAMTTRIRFSM